MKNVHIYQTELPAASVMAEAIQSSEYLFRECGDKDFRTFGFAITNAVTPMVNGYRIDFVQEEKVIPSDVVRRECNKKAAELEQSLMRELSKKECAELKEVVIGQLVEKAMTKITYFSGFYHAASGKFIVDVSKADLATKAVGIMCHMLKSIQTTTLHVSGVSNSLSQNIKDCISANQDLGFAGFSYDDKLHLANDEKETVQFKCDYTLEHVYDLLSSGYSVKRVRLYRDGLGFDLTEDFKIKSIKSNINYGEEFESKQEMEIHAQQIELELLAAISQSLVDFFKKEPEASNDPTPPASESGDTETQTTFWDEDGKDSFHDDAVKFVQETRRASVSAIQREFRIGYNRAARIIEQLEADGIVSHPGHNGNREVLLPAA